MSALEPPVLVAEDNPAMAGVLEFSLQQAGYGVHVCSNGAKAIDALRQRKFAAIITDYQMPGANGEEVIRAARSNPLNETTPIILCSAKGLEFDVDALNDAYELTAVICKPFSPREMMDLVASLDINLADPSRACC